MIRQYNAGDDDTFFNFISSQDLLNISSESNKSLSTAEWTVLVDKKPYLTTTQDFREKLYVAELLKGKDTNIRSVYQPIVSLKEHRIVAYEGLSRFTYAENAVPPVKVFEDALDIRLLGELDWTCREKIISSFPVKDSLLFVNVSPSTANCDYFGTGRTSGFVKKAGLNIEQVVLEITESGKALNAEVIKKIVLYYKNLGFRLALDDFGMGYNSLLLLFSLVNFIDYIKIPRELVDGISKSNIKLDLVRAMRDICFTNGKYVIAEGLEKVEDLECIRDIGIDHVQGFLFSKPLDIATIADPSRLKKVVDDILLLRVDNNAQNRRRGNIRNILPVIPVTGSMKYHDFDWLIHDYLCKDAVMLIEAEGKSFVLDAIQYLGFTSDTVMKDLLHFRSFDYLASNNYPWLKKLDDVPVYSHEMPSIFDLYLFFENNNKDTVLINENNRPAYYATRDEVYKSMSDMLYIDRVSVSPLTGLPGNRVIEEKIDNLLKDGLTFWIGYVDLDHFKAFNDHYGFASGDVMLKRLGSAMEGGLRERYDNRFFLGHIGGDDFLFTLIDVSREELELFAPFFASSLSQAIVSLYSEDDRKQGFFEGMDRDGTERNFPLASVSMAIACGKDRNSYIDISRALSILKKKAKMQEGTSCAIEELCSQRPE